jgi:hypothetical protein
LPGVTVSGRARLSASRWLFDTIPRTLGPAVPVLHNNDGEKVVFCRVRFPFARGTTQALIGERLDAVFALQRENAQFWNWLGSKSASGGKVAGRGTSSGMMPDCTPVAGTIEMKGRGLILAVTSAERAARGRALITGALDGLIGSPLTEIEPRRCHRHAGCAGLSDTFSVRPTSHRPVKQFSRFQPIGHEAPGQKQAFRHHSRPTRHRRNKSPPAARKTRQAGTAALGKAGNSVSNAMINRGWRQWRAGVSAWHRPLQSQ